nr:hypothetical protein [uncultured Campylobacter sp.]
MRFINGMRYANSGLRPSAVTAAKFYLLVRYYVRLEVNLYLR